MEFQRTNPSFLQLQYPLISKSLSAMAEKSLKPSSTRVAELQQYPDKKTCSIPANLSVSANTAVPNSSRKRHMGPLKSVKYGPLIKAIYKFTRVRQNYGVLMLGGS